MNPQIPEQQRRSPYVDTDVELIRKQREVQEQQAKLQRILDLQSKSVEELRTLQSNIAEQQRQLELLQSAVAGAESERKKTMQEVHEQHTLLSKLRIEGHDTCSKLREEQEKLDAQKRSLEKTTQARQRELEAKQRELQEEKNRVDFRLNLWSQKRVSSFR